MASSFSAVKKRSPEGAFPIALSLKHYAEARQERPQRRRLRRCFWQPVLLGTHLHAGPAGGDKLGGDFDPRVGLWTASVGGGVGSSVAGWFLWGPW